MSDLNYVAVGYSTFRYKKDIIFNNLYIIHNNFDNKLWQDMLSFASRDPLIDWLFSYD